MVRRVFPSAALFLLASLAPAPGWAQEQNETQMLRVFLDCGPCDFDFVRTEISYVDWMRDRADADLHVLARQEVTGSGGRIHTLDFIGLQRFQGKSDTLSYNSGRDDTQDTTRRGLAKVLHMGLMRYIAGTPAADLVAFEITQPANESVIPVTSAQARDPWNAWVFSIGPISAFTDGESNRNNLSLNYNVGANRVTAAWKINLSARGNYGRNSVTYDIGPDSAPRDTTVISGRENYNASVLIVKSMTGRASAGARINAGSSTFSNTKFFINVEPAFEFNVFPYTESTRRQLLFSYSAGVRSQTYAEETIYNLMEETRPVHSGYATYSTRQTWGNANFGVNASQFLHDRSFYNVNFNANMSVNIVRGLSFNFGANYGVVRDQLSLPKEDLTTEEVLLQQQQLATNYRYFGNFGLSYRFGSAVQNVVNTRFGGGGGFFIF
jgi:hypothetical protein